MLSQCFLTDRFLVEMCGGAAGVGLELRPTTVLLFGNPLVGTVVMQQEQRIGVDLPLSEYMDLCRGLLWIS